jgi:hypothetical protein
MKKKLRLDPENLEVDSFGLGVSEEERGTVRARSDSVQWTFCSLECGDTDTCTQNPYEASCLSYAVACPLTSGWTCGGSGCTEEITCQIWCY